MFSANGQKVASQRGLTRAEKGKMKIKKKKERDKQNNELQTAALKKLESEKNGLSQWIEKEWKDKLPKCFSFIFFLLLKIRSSRVY